MAADRDAAITRRFAKGDRIIYMGPFVGDRPLGTVTSVQKKGYRIRWDDGYKDVPGPGGVYPDTDLERVS